MSCKYSNEKLIEVLLRKGSIPQAAAELGIVTRTLYVRMKTPDFQKAFNEAKSNFLRMATAELQKSAQAAVVVLHNIMADENTPKQIRVNAAAQILTFCGRFTEQIDLLERVERLEQAAADE